MKHELCRRRIFSFAISFLVSTFAWAQGGFTCLTDSSSGPLPPGARHSCFGAAHTPKGNLHLLIVFVGFNGVGDSISVPNPAWENNLNVDDDWYWPADFDFLPNMAHDTGNVIVPGQNRLFNSDPATVMGPNQIQNLSQYFYQMSDGKFIVTADVYPRQVPVDYNVNVTDSFLVKRDSLEKMNRYALAWIQNNQAS